jgi:predicted dehydrogenase
VNIQESLSEFRRREWETESVEGMVRLAVVGLGEFARTQSLPGIEASEYTEVTALVTGSAEKGESIASDHNVAHVLSYDEFTAVGAADMYDAVYIATPTGRHLEYIEAAAEQNKAVITEKPIEKSLDRAQRVREVCENAGVTLMVAYRPRTEPTFLRARELVQNGAVGTPTHFEGSFSFRVLEMGESDQWRIDPDLAGGGALMDAGVYLATLCRFFFDSEVTSVTGTTVSNDDAFEGVDERGIFDAKFANGTTASCAASFTDYYDDRIQVRGTEGTLTIEPAFWFNESRQITVERDTGTVSVTGPNIDEVTEEFTYFGYCVLTGTTPISDADVAVRDIELLEAVYESANIGRRVDV